MPNARMVLLLASLQLAGSLFGSVAAPCRSLPVAAIGTSCRRAPHVIMETSESDLKLITCSRCKATYEIDISSFGSGQTVKCSVCPYEWFQSANRLQGVPPQMELVDYPEDMKERVAVRARARSALRGLGTALGPLPS